VDDEVLRSFEIFLNQFTKKNGKKIGERTIHGVLTLAKFLPDSKQNESLDVIKNRYVDYIKFRNHPIGIYALWSYLKFLGYNDKIIKEVAVFKKRGISALTDEEKLATSILSKKEILFLVKSIPNDRDRLIIKLLYDTGARVSEITNLKLKDIDLETKEIQVMGKGRKPRTVYFHDSTAEGIKSYLAMNNILSPNSAVFFITPMTVWYNLKKYGFELLSRELHPHMLRHSRLQHMADEGIDSFAIKSYAGHADISTTQIYVKASKYQGKLAFDKAGDVWNTKK